MTEPAENTSPAADSEPVTEAIPDRSGLPSHAAFVSPDVLARPLDWDKLEGWLPDVKSQT
jgi:hypothetical protein